MSISKIGRDAEEYVANHLFINGWFVILIPKGISGQPFDLIALKDNKFIAGDVKHVMSGERFNFSRIEPNQHTAFSLMRDSGNTEFGIFFKFKDDENVYFIYDKDIDWSKKSIHKKEMSKLL